MTRLTFKNYRTNEAFDKPYKWKLDYTSDDNKEFDFKTDTGMTYHVMFVFRGEAEKTYTGISFENEDGRMIIMNTGDAFRVFATVLDILYSERKVLHKQGDVQFTAPTDEPSRVKLYTRMVKKFSKKLGYKNVRIDTSPDNRNVKFTLSDQEVKRREGGFSKISHIIGKR